MWAGEAYEVLLKATATYTTHVWSEHVNLGRIGLKTYLSTETHFT